MSRHLLRIGDLAPEEIETVLDLAESSDLGRPLAGRGVALYFEHPSARTRNAGEIAVMQLGGFPVTIRGEEVGMDRRETVEDVTRTLACYHAFIGARVADHSMLVRMVTALDGEESEVGIVNLLSDLEHPTQALADLLTIRQCLGRVSGTRVAFIGDANNVCRSLVDGCVALGASVRIASPPGFNLPEADLIRAREAGGDVELSEDPDEAATGADVLYTDVWVSMGEEGQREEKRRAFAGFTIDERLLALAAPGAVVLHCLPAHRGEEIAASVIDGVRSRVWAQAENRMHAMRGLFAYLCAVQPERISGARPPAEGNGKQS